MATKRIQFERGYTTEMKYAIHGTVGEFGMHGKGPERLVPHPYFIGFHAYKLLKENGVTIYPISPDLDTVDGDQAYKSFEELPEPVDALIMATPGDDAIEPMQAALDAGVRKVWFMRRVMNKKLEEFCRRTGVTYVHTCPLRHRKVNGLNRFAAFCYWHGLLTFAPKFPKHEAET